MRSGPVFVVRSCASVCMHTCVPGGEKQKNEMRRYGFSLNSILEVKKRKNPDIREEAFP